MPRYKIVKSSNFDSETYNEAFVENLPVIRDKQVAQSISQAINQASDPRGPDYYRVVEENYQLHKWEP